MCFSKLMTFFLSVEILFNEEFRISVRKNNLIIFKRHNISKLVAFNFSLVFNNLYLLPFY